MVSFIGIDSTEQSPLGVDLGLVSLGVDKRLSEKSGWKHLCVSLGGGSQAYQEVRVSPYSLVKLRCEELWHMEGHSLTALHI